MEEMGNIEKIERVLGMNRSWEDKEINEGLQGIPDVKYFRISPERVASLGLAIEVEVIA